MIDENADVRKTFTDYQEESAVSLIQIYIGEGHIWKNKKLREIALPQDTLAVFVKRNGEEIIPRGNTELQEGDYLVLNAPVYNSSKGVLEEHTLTKNHSWIEKQICELNLPERSLIVMITRNGKTLIPRGKTTLKEKDVVVVLQQD